MSVRTFCSSWGRAGVSTVARSALCVLLLGGAALAAPGVLADTGSGNESGESGDDDDGDDGSEGGGDTGDTADLAYGSDSGDYGDVYEGLGPAELAKELGGGCGVVSQSASFVGLILCIGSAGRRRDDAHK